MSPENVLGRTLETFEWLPPDSLEKLAAAEGSMLALINVASDGSTRIDANLIRTGDGIVVEFEKALAEVTPNSWTFQLLGVFYVQTSKST